MFGTINENSQDENDNGEVQPRRSKRARVEQSFGPDFLTYTLEGEPQTYKEVVNSLTASGFNLTGVAQWIFRSRNLHGAA